MTSNRDEAIAGSAGRTGRVYLVGAGPGDPGLLTLRGQELLQRADVVVYDNLANEELLRHAKSAEPIFVGKRPDQHALTQDDITGLLIREASAGREVVRLKGGDPFVFGRGGEEAMALAAAGVSFEVVPGVSAGLAVPAYAGIPLTQREVSRSVTFLTGHQAAESDNAFSDSIPAEGTLVIFMGVKRIDEVVDAVQSQGRGADTPAAIVEWGTLPRQRTLVGTLASLPEQCREAGVESPSLIVVGPVVALREQLAWFEERPLFGKRVAVTRARERAAELSGLLREYGADVFEFPTVEIVKENDVEPLDDPAQYDWIVLMSVNAVDTLFERLRAGGCDIRSLHDTCICAISERTRRRLNAVQLAPDLSPEGYEPEVIADAIENAGGIEGKRFLLPRADIGRSALPEVLRARGGIVTELQAYRTDIPGDTDAFAERLAAFAPDYVTFTSVSAARNFREILGKGAPLPGSPTYVAIGPVAADAARAVEFDVTVVPDRHTVRDLVRAVVDHASSSGS